MARLPQESDEIFVPIDARMTGSLADVGLDEPRFFPSPLASTEDGLVCVGGRLASDWLLDAYRHGIFPWPVWDEEPMAWWSLDPRAILELDGLNEYMVQKDGFLAGAETVKIESQMQSFSRGLLGGEGFFILKMSGKGSLILNSFGAIHKIELKPEQEYIVDNSHLVAWSSTTSPPT